MRNTKKEKKKVNLYDRRMCLFAMYVRWRPPNRVAVALHQNQHDMMMLGPFCYGVPPVDGSCIDST